MEYRPLGNSGLKVSALGLGTNSFGRRVNENQAAAIIDQALDLGVNFLDTANMYSEGVSETFIGKALRTKRQRALIATKFGRSMGEGPNDHGASLLCSLGTYSRRPSSIDLPIHIVHGRRDLRKVQSCCSGFGSLRDTHE